MLVAFPYEKKTKFHGILALGYMKMLIDVQLLLIYLLLALQMLGLSLLLVGDFMDRLASSELLLLST